MSTDFMTIDQLAKASGTTTRTIRFYAQEKLLPAPAKFNGRLALYNDEHLEKLKLIKNLKDKYVPLAHIKTIFAQPEKLAQLQKKLEIGGETFALLGYQPPALSEKNLAKKSGLTLEEITALRVTGFFYPTATERGPMYSANDLAIANLLKTFFKFGFDLRDLGFIPQVLEKMAATLFELGHDKLHNVFHGEPAEAMALINGMAKANQELISLLYQQFLRRAIDKHHIAKTGKE
ncbi:MAG: MerR family transcriptional regulator [Actinomycetota bacterium]|nr:MerR family transcriptional regulator [Actinomycetota bacterium]